MTLTDLRIHTSQQAATARSLARRSHSWRREGRRCSPPASRPTSSRCSAGSLARVQEQEGPLRFFGTRSQAGQGLLGRGRMRGRATGTSAEARRRIDEALALLDGWPPQAIDKLPAGRSANADLRWADIRPHREQFAREWARGNSTSTSWQPRILRKGGAKRRRLRPAHIVFCALRRSLPRCER